MSIFHCILLYVIRLSGGWVVFNVFFLVTMHQALRYSVFNHRQRVLFAVTNHAHSLVNVTPAVCLWKYRPERGIFWCFFFLVEGLSTYRQITIFIIRVCTHKLPTMMVYLHISISYVPYSAYCNTLFYWLHPKRGVSYSYFVVFMPAVLYTTHFRSVVMRGRMVGIDTRPEFHRDFFFLSSSIHNLDIFTFIDDLCFFVCYLFAMSLHGTDIRFILVGQSVPA